MKKRLIVTLLLLSALAATAFVLHGCGTGAFGGTAPVTFYGAGS